jgi:hypothetical protein
MSVQLIILMIYLQNYCKNLAPEGLNLHWYERQFWICISPKSAQRQKVWLFPQMFVYVCSKFEVTLRLTVSQYVLVSSTLVRLATRYYFLSECCCLKLAVLFLWSAISDERTGLQLRWGEVILLLTVSQLLCLGIEHPCGTCDEILLPVVMLQS